MILPLKNLSGDMFSDQDRLTLAERRFHPPRPPAPVPLASHLNPTSPARLAEMFCNLECFLGSQKVSDLLIQWGWQAGRQMARDFSFRFNDMSGEEIRCLLNSFLGSEGIRLCQVLDVRRDEERWALTYLDALDFFHVASSGRFYSTYGQGLLHGIFEQGLRETFSAELDLQWPEEPKGTSRLLLSTPPHENLAPEGSGRAGGI